MQTLARSRKGFTLIELLIVITIIGILAVALVPRITGGPAKARDAARKADLQQIATALEFYADDNGYYPGSAGTAACVPSEVANYLTTVPEDPNGTVAPGCATGYSYYAIQSSGSSVVDGYLLMAGLESDDTSSDEYYDFNSTTALDPADDAAQNLANLTDCSEDAADCAGNGAMYVVGR